MQFFISASNFCLESLILLVTDNIESFKIFSLGNSVVFFTVLFFAELKEFYIYLINEIFSCIKSSKMSIYLTELSSSDIIYLPPYSPELNPAKKCGGFIKTG